jgi:hypothetical protein
MGKIWYNKIGLFIQKSGKNTKVLNCYIINPKIGISNANIPSGNLELVPVTACLCSLLVATFRKVLAAFCGHQGQWVSCIVDLHRIFRSQSYDFSLCNHNACVVPSSVKIRKCIYIFEKRAGPFVVLYTLTALSL